MSDQTREGRYEPWLMDDVIEALDQRQELRITPESPLLALEIDVGILRGHHGRKPRLR